MPVPTTPIMALESGDRLSRAEFHRRYCAHPELKKAELVEGVVYVGSPVRLTVHGRQHAAIMMWLGGYWSRHPELVVGDNATVFLDADNEVQPDAFLYVEAPRGPRLTEGGYVEGAPPFVVEVAASSASYDLHDKMRAYCRAGVAEYIVWRVLDGVIDWLRLHEGEYPRVDPDTDGVIESAQFPGLRLNVPKMLAGDSPACWLSRQRTSPSRHGSRAPTKL